MSDGASHLGVVTLQNKSVSALHALVIGIDNYLHQPHLFGASADADRIVHFLVDDLGTPHSHIVNLRDTKATRTNIIQGFQDLRDNPQIERGSPILIYFAGHGGVTPASESWIGRYRAVTKIQVIFPHDYDEEYGGERVNCIPDKTIARLLNELAEAKGDNITVIFDSCHSASGSRGSATRRARNAKVKFDIPVDVDDKIFLPVSASFHISARETNIPLCSHQTSHIHLAACGSNERAWEEEGKGDFTSALLRTIRAHGVDKVSYHNLMLGLPCLTKQTPHCYGAHRNRLLFDGRVPSQTIAYIPVIHDLTQGTLILQAGAASGVTYQSVWELRTKPVLGDEGIIGMAVADYPAVSRAPLAPKVEAENKFWELCKSGSPYEEGKIKLYARLVKSGPGSELKVWFSPEVKQLIFPELENGVQDSARGIFREFDYVAHPTDDSADMLVEIYNPGKHLASPSSSPPSASPAHPEVVFHLCNPHAKKYGVATLRERKPARRSEVETVLSAASRWNWYLNQTNAGQASGLVEMEMFKIAERAKFKGVYSDTYWWQVKESERVNLNIDETNVVDFEVYEKDLYAIRLKSKIDRPLYVRMFYFDMATLLIDDQFGHTTANKRADPDIDAFGEFTIGDDRDGGTPLPFGLDPGETIDVGCLKVFWSTDPLELNNLAQDSAFDMKRKVVKKSTGIFSNSEWGTEVLTLVQRAPAAGTK